MPDIERLIAIQKRKTASPRRERKILDLERAATADERAATVAERQARRQAETDAIRRPTPKATPKLEVTIQSEPDPEPRPKAKAKPKALKS